MRLFVWIILIVLSSFDNVVSNKNSLKPNTLYIIIGSDWCPNCKSLEKQILSDTSFMNYCHNYNVSIEKIDFPQRKSLPDSVVQSNGQLAEKLNFDGNFPSIYYINSKMGICQIDQTKSNVKDFIEALKSCKN